LMTIKERREPPLYVSLWYLIAAFVWTDVNLVLLMLGPYHIPGINNAAWHGLFIHYVVGLWITPAGYVLIYYFLPASVKNPIYSHRLSVIGFWSLAFFYPFVGIHHYLYSPIADWAETIAIVSSMMLIIPVWTVLQNFFGTMIGRWREFSRNLPAKFLIVGSLMYLVGCFQGSLEALPSAPPAATLRRLRHLALAGGGVRHVRGVGHGRPHVRLASARRCASRRAGRGLGPPGPRRGIRRVLAGRSARDERRRAVELPHRQLGLLAHHPRHLGDGARARGAGAQPVRHAHG